MYLVTHVLRVPCTWRCMYSIGDTISGACMEGLSVCVDTCIYGNESSFWGCGPFSSIKRVNGMVIVCWRHMTLKESQMRPKIGKCRFQARVSG